MITECAPSFHLMPSHRILYLGNDLALLKTLGESLEDCFVVRCPDGSLALPLMESDIVYSLFLLDEELPDTTGRELARLARRVRHRKHTPIFLLSANKAGRAGAGVFVEHPADFRSLVGAIMRVLPRLLSTPDGGHLARQRGRDSACW